VFFFTWIAVLGIIAEMHYNTDISDTALFNFVKDYTLNLLEFVSKHTMIVFGFYFGSKMFENVTQMSCDYLLRKIDIQHEEFLIEKDDDK